MDTNIDMKEKCKDIRADMIIATRTHATTMFKLWQYEMNANPDPWARLDFKQAYLDALRSMEKANIIENFDYRERELEFTKLFTL